MATNYILPNENVITNSLAMLYTDIDVKKAAVEVDATSNKVFGVFVNEEGSPVAASMCDTDFAAFAGSALMMLPPGAAQEAAETGDLSDMMVENVYEVFNICSRLLMTDETPHLKLENIYVDYEKVPADVQSMMGDAGGKEAFGIDFPRYGSGNISFVTT